MAAGEDRWPIALCSCCHCFPSSAVLFSQFGGERVGQGRGARGRTGARDCCLRPRFRQQWRSCGIPTLLLSVEAQENAHARRTVMKWFIGLVAIVFISSPVLAVEQTVWQIGKPDHDYCGVRHRRQLPGVCGEVRREAAGVRGGPQRGRQGLAVHPARPERRLGEQPRASLDDPLQPARRAAGRVHAADRVRRRADSCRRRATRSPWPAAPAISSSRRAAATPRSPNPRPASRRSWSWPCRPTSSRRGRNEIVLTCVEGLLGAVRRGHARQRPRRQDARGRHPER